MTLSCNSPSELLAGVPSLLGFCPRKSLIVMGLAADAAVPARGSLMEVLLRHDLPTRPMSSSEPAEPVAELVASRLGAQCAGHLTRNGCTEAVVIIVDAEHGHDPDAHRGTIAGLHNALRDAGIGLVGAYTTTATAHGAPWVDVLVPARTGVVTDPETSPVTAAMVYRGAVVRESREDLAELVAADTAAQRQIAALLDSADTGTGIAPVPVDVAGCRDALEFVLARIDRLAAGQLPVPAELARLAVALRARPVRDSLLALAGGDRAGDAEALWTLLTRVLPAPDRAEPASLLAYSSLLHGQGVLAGIALDIACTAAPGHRLATLLEHGLNLALPPARLRAVADTGYQTALELGVHLPELTSDLDTAGTPGAHRTP